MSMYNPPHPGETLKEMYLDPLDLSVSDAARRMGMTRAALSEIVNKRRGVSARVAIKLAKAFSCSAESWMSMQSHYDLWQAKQKYEAADVEVIYEPKKVLQEVTVAERSELKLA